MNNRNESDFTWSFLFHADQATVMNVMIEYDKMQLQF